MNFNLFSTIFISIILEAFPFLFLGTLLSSIIEIFTSTDFFNKIIPKNKYAGLLLASLSGLVFPVCECAIVPIAGRLLKKKVPLYFTITFMLSVPTVNITVILSTYYAFSTHIHLLFLRIGLGILIPIIIGYIISLLKNPDEYVLNTNHVCGCEHENHNNHLHNEKYLKNKKDKLKLKMVLIKIKETIRHTIEEFFETGKFLILGALFTALFQSTIPRNILSGVSNDVFLSTSMMMIFSFLLSICSQTDAFIARSFIGQFTQGSILVFVVFGAMLDLKNTLMFKRIFKSKFIYLLIILIVVICFLITGIIGLFLGV